MDARVPGGSVVDGAGLEEGKQVSALSDLAAHVRKCYAEAKDAKRLVEQQMLDNLRQRRGEYAPDKLAVIRKQGLSDLFLKLTDSKCRGAESWIRDVLLPAGDKPWTMDATPIPDLPDELEMMVLATAVQNGMGAQDEDGLRDAVRAALQEDAEERAGCMEKLCEDQQVEGGFRNALGAIIADVVTLKAGIMKAPVLRNSRRMTWGRDFRPVPDERVGMFFERVSPFDLYPSPGAVDCQRAAYVIEHHHLQPGDIELLLGVDGFDDAALRSVLDEFDGGSFKWLDVSDDVQALQRSEFENDTTLSGGPASEIDALQFFGQVKGQWLIDWGWTGDIEAGRWHEAEVWLVGEHVIKARLNEHPLGLRPYYHTGAVKMNDQFWHQSIPELMTDCQDISNASARNLVNNMGMASGPQVAIDDGRVRREDQNDLMYPWKVWHFKPNDAGGSSNPIQFFQPNSNSGELLGVLNHFKTLADELTGVPAYSQGIANAGGAGKTASGLSMLMGAAAKGIRSIIYNIDIDIIEPVLYAQFVWNMLYHDDDSVKGDITIKPRGAAALVVKEQLQLRRGEFLASTANPVDMQIIGVEGRAELLREMVKGLDMPGDRIVPSRQEMQQRMAAQEQQMQMQQMQQMQQPQQAMPPELLPDGQPAGGHGFNQF
ncbi:portal protein [Candidatus Thiothrix phosphatis]